MAEDSINTTAALGADPDAIVPRVRAGEAGFTGLKISNGEIIEEANRVFRYPSFLKVVNEMSNNPTVAGGLNVYKMMIGRVKWTVEAPDNATATQKERANFVAKCMEDMENSWGQFITETLTYLQYGFAVQEKVFRRRLRRNGSKYNDGLIGLRKIAPRSQDTIQKWNYSQDGRELLSVSQSLTNLENGFRYQNLLSPDGLLEIDRNKFMLFTADSTKGNPQGRSILKPIYLAYKRLEMMQDQEALGVSKDANGIPLVRLPPAYMAADASTNHQAVYTATKNIVNGLAAGIEKGIVFPQAYDPESKLPMFDISLLERKGGNAYDVNEIIKRYKSDILQALSVDVIQMGQDGGGSFSLADSKTNLLAIALSYRLREIENVLNTDLVPQLFALNGWTDTDLPKFKAGDLEEVSMEELSKLVQRVASTGLLEIDRPVLNRIREAGGFPLKPSEEPVDWEHLTGADSKSGSGMKVGTSGQGTSKIGGKGSGKDASANNSDNAA